MSARTFTEPDCPGAPRRAMLTERSYAHGPSDLPLLGETIGESFRRTVLRHAERDALAVRHQDYRATWGELWDQVDVAARAFMAHGVAKGDRIGIWAPNRYEWVVTQLAAARIGAILVTINPAYTQTELAYALEQAGVSVLVMARGFRDADYLGMFLDVLGDCPQVREAIVLEDDWDVFLAEAASIGDDQLAEREASLEFDDPIILQYTSGTTGSPKGVTLSHHNVVNNAFFAAWTLQYGAQDRVCVPVPFYHCFGMVAGTLANLTQGACTVVPSESFDPRAVLTTIEEERCTSLLGVPTMFIAELEQADFHRFDLRSLRTGMMGGAPCPAEVLRKVRRRMHMEYVTIICGMTETSPISTQTVFDDPLDKRMTTVGRVHPHVEIKLVDPETGAIVPRGTPGEQCTRGYSVMLGYWNDEAATSSAIDSAGWMHSGDLAVMDDDGYVRIVGRLKDMIIRGGENISPREIEEFLHRLPDVSDAEVFGVPSERYGEEVAAWVKLRDGAAIGVLELAQACRGRLASFKIPRHWKIVDGFPMTVTGKVQKFRMRELASAELGLRSEGGVA
jgi:fatty-acyl-CoA synthase